MSERILHLTLKKRWFDMILTSDKKEEYREIKPYWIRRLMNSKKIDPRQFNKIQHGTDQTAFEFWKKKFDFIIFKNGYSKNAREIKVECNGIHIGKPVFKWHGAEITEDVFVISLGNIVETKNI